MAKAQLSYSGLSLKAPSKPSEKAAETEDAKPSEASADDAARRPRPMESKSSPTLIYLSKDAKKALRQYIAAQEITTKVHDVLIEALQEWGEKRGFDKSLWRAPSTRPRKV